MREVRSGAVLAVAVVLLAAPGCSSPEAGAPVLLEAPGPEEGLALSMQSLIPASKEATFCRHFVVPEDGEPLAVGRFEHRYSPGSHHLILFRTDRAIADVAAETEPWECATASVTYPVVYGGQSDAGELALPDGVALTFQPGEVLLMQTHYLNPTANDLTAEVRLNLWSAPRTATIEAGTFFFYDWAIVAPPGESTARMRCAIPEDIELLSAQSHMHRRGIGYDSWVVDPGDPGADPVPVFSTNTWQDVAPGVYSPPIAVRAGQAIDFECRYRNDEGRTIVEGPSAIDNEMCMFVGLYYPRLELEAESCMAPGSGPRFEGSQTCSDTIGCQFGAADDVEAAQCLAGTCSASGDELIDLARCTVGTCGQACRHEEGEAEDCPSCLSDDCQSCVFERCAGQIQACIRSDC